jgi:hypothetical protein
MAEELLLELMDSECLYTIVGGILPASKLNVDVNIEILRTLFSSQLRPHDDFPVIHTDNNFTLDMLFNANDKPNATLLHPLKAKSIMESNARNFDDVATHLHLNGVRCDFYIVFS